ncbi:MAG: single-stranded DNA-binding protein [Bdellovibrionia bacterium]
MSSINRVFLSGRLGAKPESKTNRNGKPYARFSVATNRWRKEGEAKIQETDWHFVQVYGYDAQACLERLDKGSQIFVEGELHHFKREEDGKSRYYTTINAQKVTFPALPLQSATAS